MDRPSLAKSLLEGPQALDDGVRALVAHEAGDGQAQVEDDLVAHGEDHAALHLVEVAGGLEDRAVVDAGYDHVVRVMGDGQADGAARRGRSPR